MADEKRLIDANALLARLASSSESWAKNIQAIRNWWPHAVGIKDNIVSLVKEAPTVDAVEVVHGWWVSSGCGFDCCSECRKVYADGYLTAMGIKPRMQFNYCPNCGAKMDGEDDG